MWKKHDLREEKSDSVAKIFDPRENKCYSIFGKGNEIKF